MATREGSIGEVPAFPGGPTGSTGGRMRSRPFVPFGLWLALAVAGCEVGPNPPALADRAVDEPTREPAPPGGPTTEERSEARISLLPVGPLPVRASATLVRTGDLAVVVLEATGLPGAGTFPVDLHRGGCDAAGPRLGALDPVAGLADGTGESLTTLDRREIPERGPIALRVHDPGGAVLACGSTGAGSPAPPRDTARSIVSHAPNPLPT